jgi:hypothetical protein
VLFAMFVYSLVALGVRSLIDWLTYRRERLERQLHHDQMMLQQASLARQQARRPSGQQYAQGAPSNFPRE